MGKLYLIPEEVLTGIADKIRELNGTSAGVMTENMPEALEDSKEKLIDFLEGNTQEIVIPNGTTALRDYLFRGMGKLTSITIPEGVTSIGDGAFGNCDQVELFDFTACTSVPTLSSTTAFENIPSSCKIRVPAFLYDAWKSATNWSKYADYIVAFDVEHKHTYTGAVTEPTCTEQGYTTYTCSGCGDSYISDYTDALGHDYKTVVTEPTRTEYGYTTYTCSVCGHSYVSDYVDPLPYSLGLAYSLDSDCASYIVSGMGECEDADISIPSTYQGLPVSAIKNDAFKNNTDIVSVTIPDSVTSIGMRTFYGCTNLASVSIPDSVTSIGAYTFDECPSLANLTIPNGIKLYSEGLEYSGYAGGSSKWTVEGMGTCTDTDLIIPSTYNGKPVVMIQSNAFNPFGGSTPEIKRMVLPGSITNLGGTVYMRTTKVVFDFTSHTTIPSIQSTSLGSTGASREILVPTSLYDSWIKATNWANYADKIIAVEVKNNGNN